VLYRIDTEGLQTPVSISFLSVYPHEDERLSPPLTRIKMGKGGKKLVQWVEVSKKWVEVSQENRKKSRVLSEENEHMGSAVKKTLNLTWQGQSTLEKESPFFRDCWRDSIGNQSLWKDVPSDEAVCVKVDGKYYQPLFEYHMEIQF